jgi:nitrate reductase NapE component
MVVPSINATFVTSRNTTKVLVPLTPSFRDRNERLNEFIILILCLYQLLAQGRWFSPGTPASSPTKTGRHDIAEILLYVVATRAPSINAMFVTSRNTTKVLVPFTPSFRGRNERLKEFIILILCLYAIL